MSSYRPVNPPYRFSLLASSTASTSTTPRCNLYRGSLPKPHNLKFLTRLQLKTIISLTPKSIQTYVESGELVPPRRKGECEGGTRDHHYGYYSHDHDAEDEHDGRQNKGEDEGVTGWIERTGINVIHFKVGKAKDGAIPFPTSTVKAVLEVSCPRCALFTSSETNAHKARPCADLTDTVGPYKLPHLHSRPRRIRRHFDSRGHTQKITGLE